MTLIKTMVVIFLALASVGTATAQQAAPRPMQECAEFLPYGFPQINRSGMTPICRMAYALLHDNNARIAAWVAYSITYEQTLGCEPRVNAFAPDHSLPRGQRAELSDYAGSGFDTGHIANNADMSWHPIAARESFILSNMAPQIPALNRGAWRQLESAIRGWAFNSRASLTIYSGSVYDLATGRRIGQTGVVVPNGFYKIVINNSTRQTLAFLFPHSDVNDFRLVQTTVAEIEEVTGIRFPIPDDRHSRNRVWTVEMSPLLSARRDRCRG